MTSCTWPWGDSASLWPSAHREELRRPGARPTPSAKILLSLGGERVSSTAAGRIGATGRERTLYAAAALSLGCASPLMGDARALRGVVGLRGFLCCGWRSPDTLRPDRGALADPDNLTRGHRGQPRDRDAVPADANGGDSIVRTRGRGVERFGFVDVCATASEMGIAVALSAALLRNATPERRRTIVLIVAVGLVSVGHVVHLVLRAS